MGAGVGSPGSGCEGDSDGAGSSDAGGPACTGSGAGVFAGSGRSAPSECACDSGRNGIATSEPLKKAVAIIEMYSTTPARVMPPNSRRRRSRRPEPSTNPGLVVVGELEGLDVSDLRTIGMRV